MDSEQGNDIMLVANNGGNAKKHCICVSLITPRHLTTELSVTYFRKSCRNPVSRARSSPVPGVVAYFRPSYAAGQE